MTNLLKIENLDGFVKDEKTGALLNADSDALRAYKAKKEQIRLIYNMREEIEKLKNEIQMLKAHIGIN